MSDYPIVREVVCINCEVKFILEEGEEDREFCCDRCRRSYWEDGFAYEDSYNLEE